MRYVRATNAPNFNTRPRRPTNVFLRRTGRGDARLISRFADLRVDTSLWPPPPPAAAVRQWTRVSVIGRSVGGCPRAAQHEKRSINPIAHCALPLRRRRKKFTLGRRRTLSARPRTADTLRLIPRHRSRYALPSFTHERRKPWTPLAGSHVHQTAVMLLARHLAAISFW